MSDERSIAAEGVAGVALDVERLREAVEAFDKTMAHVEPWVSGPVEAKHRALFITNLRALSPQEGVAGVTLDVERRKTLLAEVGRVAVGVANDWMGDPDHGFILDQLVGPIEAWRAALSPTPEAAPDGLDETLDSLLPFIFDKAGCPQRDGTGPCNCGRDDAVRTAALAAAPRSLDAAWAACEAALPEGWRFSTLTISWDDVGWSAEAESFQPWPNAIVADAATPAAALDALTAKLRERPA